jgi:hypothetical protein
MSDARVFYTLLIDPSLDIDSQKRDGLEQCQPEATQHEEEYGGIINPYLSKSLKILVHICRSANNFPGNTRN